MFSCRAEVEEDGDCESNNGLCEERLKCREEMDGNGRPKSSIPSRSRAPKRPDKPLYMPRAARDRLSLQNSQGPSDDHEFPSPASSSCRCTSSSSDSCSCPETPEKPKSSSTSTQECVPSEAEGVLNHDADSSAICPQEEKQKIVLTLHEAEPLEQTVSCFTDMSLEEDEKGKEDVCIDDVTEEVSLLLSLCYLYILLIHILI